MMRYIFLITGIAITFFLATGCSNNDPSQEARSTGNASGNTASKNLRILFRWPGDDFATRQQLEARDKIARLIEDRQIGYVVHSGTGMGWMDIVIEVTNKDSSRMEIEKIINEISPQANFSFLSY